MNADDLQRQIAELSIKARALDEGFIAFDIVDAQGKFLYANKQYLRLWGYDSLEEIIGTSPAFHCADPGTPLRIITEVRTKGHCDIEFLAKRKDGSTFMVRMWVNLAEGPSGEEIYPTTSVDLTDQKLTEDQLRDAIRTRDEFLSIASHELNTPLTALKLQVQLAQRRFLRQGNLTPEDLQKFMDSQNRSIDRLSRLVGDMLDIARLRTGKLTISKERINFVDVVRSVLAQFQEQFPSQNFTSRLPPELWLEWDAFRLEQVIENLLSNAVKYAGASPIEVEVTGQELKVIDHGQGVPVTDRERIFDRFERATSPSEASGMGLGLAIAKEILVSHGGHISVEDTPGGGATFVVKL